MFTKGCRHFLCSWTLVFTGNEKNIFNYLQKQVLLTKAASVLKHFSFKTAVFKMKRYSIHTSVLALYEKQSLSLLTGLKMHIYHVMDSHTLGMHVSV